MMKKQSIKNIPIQINEQQQERTLTRRMHSILHDLDSDFEVYNQYDFEKQIQAVRSASPQARPTEMQRLIDMLRPLHFDKESPSVDDCAEFVKRYFSVNLYQNSTLERMMSILCKKYISAPTPIDYLKRIVDDLGDPAWKNDSLRVRILKQAIRYGDYLVKPFGVTSKKQIQKALNTEDMDTILSNIDEAFFAAEYDNKSKAIQKNRELFRFADELAGAKFRTDGQIEKLYIFAVIFNMTYLLSDGSRDVKRDIELRLFYQYYTDNAFRPRGSAYTKYVSERGVNLKNFYEVMYLYYICQENMEPEEKLRRIIDNKERLDEWMQEHSEAAEQSGEKQEVTDETEESVTQMYVNTFEEIVRLPEDLFLERLKYDFQCDHSNVSGTSIAIEQKTAFRVFERILDEIAEYDREYHQTEILTSKDNKKAVKDGLMSSDAEEQGQKLSEKEWKEKYPIYQEAHKIAETRIGYIYSPSLADMISITEKILKEEKDPSVDWNSFLTMLKEMNHLVTMDASKVTENNICRTLMVVFLLQLFYYDYGEMSDEMSADELYDLNTDYRFTKFFADFQAFARPFLLKAKYQEISGKHLTDVILVFSLYITLKNFF